MTEKLSGLKALGTWKIPEEEVLKYFSMQSCKLDGVALIMRGRGTFFLKFVSQAQEQGIDCFPFAEEKCCVENKAGGMAIYNTRP